MPGHEIIVLGASAGGVEALCRLVAVLPADLPAAVFVVLHVPANGKSVLPQILSRAGPVPATHARDGEPIKQGHVYIAPPDHHLLIHRGVIEVIRGPRENGHRPAVDPLFRTAAQSHGARVVGAVLSGALDDGTAGLVAIKERGGVALVQDPLDALVDSMPRSALDHLAVDACLSAEALGAELARLARAPVSEPSPPVKSRMRQEVAAAEMDPHQLGRQDHPGTPSAFACPECHGVLWEIHDGALVRYRCRVGHAYSPETMVADHSASVEGALWAALRALEENGALTGRMRDQATARGLNAAARRFAARAAAAYEHAEVLRRMLLQSPPRLSGEDQPDAVPYAADG